MKNPIKKSKKHSLPCPAYDSSKHADCDKESFYFSTSTKGNDWFRCREHGVFGIDKNGDLIL
jgi:hypothetical protein